VGTFSLRIQVEGEPVKNYGNDEAANLSRLRWLNSTVGSESTVTAPFTNVSVYGQRVGVLGRELELGVDGLPSQITSFFNDANTAVLPNGRPLLSNPFAFVVEREDGPVTWRSKPVVVVRGDLEAHWTAAMEADGLRADVQGRLDYTGSGEIAIRLTAERDMEVKDIRLVIPWHESGEGHTFIASQNPGDFVEFTFTEQFEPQKLTLRATTSHDFGIARISINGKVVADNVDLYSASPAVRRIGLGVCEPVENRFVFRIDLIGPNPRSRGARTYMGLDSLIIGE
jgi:hypothetical protein